MSADPPPSGTEVTSLTRKFLLCISKQRAPFGRGSYFRAYLISGGALAALFCLDFLCFDKKKGTTMTFQRNNMWQEVD